MSLSMSTVATQSFLQTLTALSKILDKAAAHCAAKKIDEAVLLTDAAHAGHVSVREAGADRLRFRQEHDGRG